MKSETDRILEAQKIQVLSNALRLQALLETLVDLEILDAELFNDLVEQKYQNLNQELIKEAKARDDETENDIKYYGTMGEA